MQKKVKKVMKEYKSGELKSGSGAKVKSRKQAEEQKRQYAEDLAAKQRARRTGGKRSLLAEGRFSPELGVTEDETKTSTLGTA